MSFSGVPFSAVLLLIVPPVLWGGNFVVGSALSSDLSGIWMNLLRWVIALAALVPLCARPAWKARRVLFAHWRELLLLAALGISGFNSLLYIALHYASVPIAAVAFACTPFVILGIVSILDRRWPSQRLLMASVLALSGMILAQRHALNADVAPLGVALVVLAALTWGGYCVAIKRLPIPAPPRATFLAQVVIGLVLLIPVAATLEPIQIGAITLREWLGLTYIGIGAGAVAFWLWNIAVPKTGSARASLFMNLVPISGIVLSAVFLGETLSTTELVAIVIVFAGIFASLDWSAHRRVPGTRAKPS